MIVYVFEVDTYYYMSTCIRFLLKIHMCGHTVLHIHSTNDTSKILLIYCKNNDIVELDFLSIKAYNIIFARSHNNLGVDR